MYGFRTTNPCIIDKHRRPSRYLLQVCTNVCGASQAARGYARDLIDCGTWFVGAPDQVADRIVEQYNMTGGFGTLLQLGYDYSDDSDRALWFRSMELLSTVVIPKVNARLGFTPRT